MISQSSLSSLQEHFLRSLLEGKREIGEKEAEIRKEKLSLINLIPPCVVVCVSPYYNNVSAADKDILISDCLRYVDRFLNGRNYIHYCLANAYDNIQIILPTEKNQLYEQSLDELFIRLHEKFHMHFGLELFVGIGSVVDHYSDISRSALEAMEMLAYKHQYADRGVINIINTARFKHYSLYGEDIMFARVIGRFQDGDLGMMAVRLNELVESIRKRPRVSKTAIKRTFIELAVNILHIASNADVDVDSVLGDVELYGWVLQQNHTEVLSEWLLNLSGNLLKKMEAKQTAEEKEIITQACDFIAGHIGEPDLSLQKISEAVGLSGAYFSQLFKLEKGIGLTSYINDSRIAQAKQLLRETEIKSEDIALQLGFTSATYFGRVFKKVTGTTPNSYRKQVRIADKGIE